MRTSALTPPRTTVLADPDVTKKFSIASVWAKQGTFQNSLHAAPFDPAPVFAETLAKMYKGDYNAEAAHAVTVKGVQDMIIRYLST